jgi:hypothetical protein
MLLPASLAFSQDSLQVMPLPSDPNEQITNPSDSIGKKEDRVKIHPKDLPNRMIDLLDKEEKYNDWENGVIYFDKGNDHYLIHINTKNGTKTYRFDKEGQPIISDMPANESPGSKQ